MTLFSVDNSLPHPRGLGTLLLGVPAVRRSCHSQRHCQQPVGCPSPPPGLVDARVALYFIQVIKGNVNIHVLLLVCTLNTMWWKWHCICDLLPQAHNPSQNTRKTSDKFHQRGILQYTWLCVCAIYLCAQLCSTLCDPMDCSHPWTVATQSPVSGGFSRQEYWSGLPFPSPRDWTHLFCIAGRFCTTEPPRKPKENGYECFKKKKKYCLSKYILPLLKCIPSTPLQRKTTQQSLIQQGIVMWNNWPV